MNSLRSAQEGSSAGALGDLPQAAPGLQPLPQPQPPHTPLPDYYAQGNVDERRRFLTHIFDDTAVDYNRIESMMALGSGRWYRRQALLRAGLAAGMQVVDVGCGTGLVAREALGIVGAGGALVGLDPSPGMLAQAQLEGPARFEMIEGRAEAIARPDASADFLSLGYALRHIDDVGVAFAEFRRVLRPGGRLLVLEITRPESGFGRAVLKAYMRTVVPALARLVARSHETTRLWRYYWDTIDACIAPPLVLQALQHAGFTAVRRHVELGIFSEYTARAPLHS
jgi:demethylmenaquinone methyltransferase/2-methoxy-6-polyprenyl-1,4-benzoquinol methylase